jgi:hypothetical protein
MISVGKNTKLLPSDYLPRRLYEILEQDSRVSSVLFFEPEICPHRVPWMTANIRHGTALFRVSALSES